MKLILKCLYLNSYHCISNYLYARNPIISKLLLDICCLNVCRGNCKEIMLTLALFRLIGLAFMSGVMIVGMKIRTTNLNLPGPY